VPVLDGVACAVTMIEGLHAYGLNTSKTKAFLTPEPKELVNCPGALVAAYARQQESGA
jgi:hypothetical protein